MTKWTWSKFKKKFKKRLERYRSEPSGKSTPIPADMSCEGCSRSDGVKFCEACNVYYCDPCWHTYRFHRENRAGASGILHSQLDPDIARRIIESTSEPKNEDEEQKLHEADEETLWFGLSKDYGDPMLAEYRRFMTIMLESSSGTSSPRYPGLVSFVGQTGSGKSTLIRLLMKRGDKPAMATPVIGRSNGSVPTSADVHLYLDPASKPERPILFADCEGFEGGERDPIAQSVLTPHQLDPRATAPTGQIQISHLPHYTRRALKWAAMNTADHATKGKRQYTVSEMYPRILHVFSDVVVFVLDNPRTMEGVVEKLLLWADSNYSASINLPSKPYAIIVLNKSSSSTSGDQWSKWQATEEFFSSMKSQLHKNKTFENYVNKWARSKKTITTMQELFECYYSGVHVVRIPEKNSCRLLQEQGEALYGVIQDCCQSSFQRKQDRKMLSDADQFQLYLSIAFDHFSSTLDEPFDYVKASLQHRPPPEGMGDRLLEFAILVGKKRDMEGDVKKIFDSITHIVASCIMLDSARKHRFGYPQDWFAMPVSESADSASGATSLAPLDTSYQGICKDAINEYFETEVPCDFEVKTDDRHRRRHFKCDQRYRTHEEVHRQAENRLAEQGPYYPGRFEPRDFHQRSIAWGDQIAKCLRDIYSEYEGSDLRVARVTAHRRNLENFYTPLLQHDFFSNIICLACMFNPAQYTLRCGHILCRECILDFGQPGERSQVILECCPLSGGIRSCETGSKDDVPADVSVIELEPAHSGLRILTLDGGGIRGIVELAVLKEIESRIDVPLQRFFDLVVGTSTGGIVSLGFGHSQWPLEECIQRFRGLVQTAFTERKFLNFKFIRKFEQLIKKSKYKSKPLEGALQEAFNDMPMFGSPLAASTTREKLPLKVSVVTVSGLGKMAHVISNYNVRRVSPLYSEPYYPHRPRDPKDELKVWQAARATSAAPGYFKPFDCAGLQLLDGALMHNNPIEIAMAEARSIAAANNLCEVPDLVLSLGTGLQRENEDPAVAPGVPQRNSDAQPPPSFVETLFTLIKYQIKLNLDADIRWNKWRREVSDTRLATRIFRINPDLKEAPPLLDDVAQVEPLYKKVTQLTQTTPAIRDNIDEIACRLVASSFYFARPADDTQNPPKGSRLRVSGFIRCRLADGEDLKGLGRYLGRYLGKVKEPAVFTVANRDSEPQRLPVPVQGMITDGYFTDVPLVISLPDEEAQTKISIELSGSHKNVSFSISGFPRCLMKHDFGARRV